MKQEKNQILYSPDAYLINPNTNDTIWWHFTTVHGLEAFNMRSFQVQPGSGMTFMGRSDNIYDLYSPHTATFFGGSPISFYGRFDMGEAEILQVKIRLGENCRLFDARNLYSDVPRWVINEMERALLETEDLHEIEDALPENGNEGSLSKEAFDYLMSQNLGETLNLWRQRFNAYRDVNAYFVEELWEKKGKGKTFRCYDIYTSWAAFALALWGLKHSAVQCVMNSYNHTKDEYPILGEKGSYVGWLERESLYNGLDSDYDSINVAILHTSDTSVPYVDIECLEMTEIEIVGRERENPYPHYTDCDDSMASLLAEIQNEDVDALKDEIIGLAEQSLDDRFLEVYGEQISESDIRELKRGLKEIRTIDHLDTYVESLIDQDFWGSLSVRLLPVRYAISDAQIREDLECVHYTNMDFRFSKDIKKDLAGRATPSRLMMTGSQVDFEIQGNGYIYAYPSREVQDKSWLRDFSWAKEHKYVIKLNVSKCISFYHRYDRDIQCIVPVLCIDSAEFSRNPDYAWPERDYHFDTPEEYEDFLESRTPRVRLSPDAKEVIVKCIECKERFTRHPLEVFRSSRAGRFKVSDEYICSLCRDDYDAYVSELESYPITVYPVDGEPYPTEVKFFSELQDITEESIGIRFLEVLINDGTSMLLCADAIPGNYDSDFVDEHTNRNFSEARPILGPVIQISVEGLDALEYKDPR